MIAYFFVQCASTLPFSELEFKRPKVVPHVSCLCVSCSYSVVQLRGLRLHSDAGFYDRVGSGAARRPRPLARGVGGVRHGRRRRRHRPASAPAERAHLGVARVQIPLWPGGWSPEVQQSRGGAGPRAGRLGGLGSRPDLPGATVSRRDRAGPIFAAG